MAKMPTLLSPIFPAGVTLLVALATPLAHAQSANAPGQANKADSAQLAAAQATVRTGMAQAKTLAKGKNLTAVEATLGALNHAKPNTAAWHTELAHRLVETASQLARDGDSTPVTALANLAIQHLTQADGLAKTTSEHAAAKTLTAYIQERILGDTSAALATYQAAVQAAPKASGAKEAVDRLTRTQTTLRGTSAPGTAQ